MGARRDDITAGDRMQIGVSMLSRDRTRGEPMRLAQAHKVSRRTVYHIAAKTEQVLMSGLAPGRHGPAVDERVIRVNRNRLVRGTLALSEAGVSQRGVTHCLAELLDTSISPGWVNARLAELEKEAARVNAGWQPASGEGLSGDELYANAQPQLLVAGNDSLFAYALSGQTQCDGDTWGCVLLEMPSCVQFASDAGTGLAAGAAIAGLEHQLDWDHLLRPLWHQAAQLERRAYAALDALDARARKFDAARTEKRLAQHLSQWEKLCDQAEQAIQRYDQFDVLARQVDREFAMIDVTTGQLRDPEASRTRLEALGQQIKTLPGRACHKLGTHLVNWAKGLLSYLPRLANALQPLLDTWGQPAILALSRIWQIEADLKRGHLPRCQRKSLEHLWHSSLDLATLCLGDHLFVAWDALAALFGRVWRGSMLAEYVNRRLRAWLDRRQHNDQGTLDLFRFSHNTRPFERGKRAGFSPAELVGLSLPADRFSLLGLAPKV